MQRAAFILTGGYSSRMGQDKALLPWAGATIAEFLAETAGGVVQSTMLVGEPERYADLKLKTLRDLRPGLGPLSGLEAALTATQAEWNLILSCDIVQVTPALIEQLFSTAKRSAAACVLTRDASQQIQPLCGVYHQRCLTEIRNSIDAQDLRLMNLISRLHPMYVDLPEPLLNINTPDDWRAALSLFSENHA
jgi:molybdenum cofactor guanylyltransferase